MKNLGHADSVKQEGIVRLFHTNPNGFGLDGEEKMQMLLQSQKRVNFDGIFLSSLDYSWNNRRVDDVKRKLSNIGQSIKINTSNAEKKSTSANRHLPGGTISVAWNQL